MQSVVNPKLDLPNDFTTCFSSPIGVIFLRASDEGLQELSFVDDPPIFDETVEPASKILLVAVKELTLYFDHNLKEFETPLDFQGTDFQKVVWNELTHIPYGQTISYSDLAIRIGNVKATRAVGTANGRNPISIMVPCHRVIGSDGSLTGYGGGLHRKEYLLQLEGRLKSLF